MKGIKNVDKYMLKMNIRRTPGVEALMAAFWKLAKVLGPLAGALMPPTIPDHIINMKDWDIDQQIYREDNGEWAEVACSRTKEL